MKLVITINVKGKAEAYQAVSWLGLKFRVGSAEVEGEKKQTFTEKSLVKRFLKTNPAKRG